LGHVFHPAELGDTLRGTPDWSNSVPLWGAPTADIRTAQTTRIEISSPDDTTHDDRPR